jgi:molybdate transport system regulatory protein
MESHLNYNTLDHMAQMDHAKPMARITIRVDFESGASLGPGKIRLLEEVEKTGSIRNAATALGMSFRQAWLLLKAIEDMFGQPVIATQRGGTRGGGSVLTDLGRLVIANYRQLEHASVAAAHKEIAVLEKWIDSTAPAVRRRKISRKPLKSK